VRRAVRLLDALAVGLAAGAVAILATGGGHVGRLALTRAEDLVVALAVVLAVRALAAPVPVPRVRPVRAVAAGIAVYAVLMGFITVTRHLVLRTHALDLGYYVQVVWNMAAGRGALVTMPPMHAWGDHLSPVLYVFGAVAWVWPGAVPLLLGQTLILGAGAAAVFAFAARVTGHRAAAAALALVYLVNPTLHGINVRDVHPQAFAIPLVIAAAAACDAGRYGWCALALVATLGGREDAAIAVVGFGAWLAMARRRWALGVAIAAASVALLAVDVALVMPLFRGEPYPHLHRYTWLGASSTEMATSLVLRPDRWLPVVATLPKGVYLLALLAPLGFLPLLAPRVLVAALPGLAVNLLSTDPVLFHHRSQYQAFVLPFLVLAAVEGYARLRAWTDAGRLAPAWRARALALAGLVALALTARTVNDLTVTRWRPWPEVHAARALMARIPPTASVSANERLVPHLATRPEVYVFPAGVPRSAFVLELRGARVPDGYRAMATDGPWTLWERAPGG
jgi:uncharacterized membrane protein